MRLASECPVLAMGSNSWVLGHEVMHRSRASRKSHLNSYRSLGHFWLSLARALVRMHMYMHRRVPWCCVDRNRCKGRVYYVEDALKHSWETVLRSWCVLLHLLSMGLGDPHSRLHIWVTSSLPAKPWLHLSSIFIIIGLDYYFPWVPKFYIIHIHCNILDKYKRMWASGGRILIIPFYVCIQEHMLHFYFLLCCFPLLRSCLTNCFLNLFKLRLHYICFHLSKNFVRIVLKDT